LAKQEKKMIKEMAIQKYWGRYLVENNLNPGTKYYEAMYFGMTEELANSLLEMVLSGQKKATASSLLAFDAEESPMPQVGDLSIVTDWAGTPHCIMKTTAITIIPFNEMTFDLCKREGEDETLASWRESHGKYFAMEGDALGYKFSEEMPVVFEDFEIVWK
jgi:uncharacterized protein YhfF